MYRVLMSAALVTLFGLAIYFTWPSQSLNYAVVVLEPGTSYTVSSQLVEFCRDTNLDVKFSHDLEGYKVNNPPVIIIYADGEELIRIKE